MIIVNTIGLIGDYLGTLPAITDYIRKGNKKELKVIVPPQIRGLNELLPEEIQKHFVYDPEAYNPEDGLALKREYWAQKYNDYEMPVCFNIHRAFTEAGQKGHYMGQAYYNQLLRPVGVAKAELSIQNEQVSQVDFVISPFSRCLPEEQKVKQSLWQQFIDSHPEYTFVFLGTTKYDPIDYLKGDNVKSYFDHTWNQVGNMILKSKGLLSVITGTAHFSYHIGGTKNAIFSNQGFAWGTNPHSINNGLVYNKKPIPQLTLEDLDQALSDLIK